MNDPHSAVQATASYISTGRNPVTGSEMEIFNFDGHRIRTETHDGQVWFVAADVCDVLGIVKVSNAVSRLDISDARTTGIRSGGQMRAMTVVNESGLYDLILDSRKPEARRFRRWVTAEVLPTIRHTGGYVDPETLGAKIAAGDPEAAYNFIQLVTATAARLRADNEQLAAANHHLAAEHVVLAPKAAAYDAWFDTNDTCSVRDAARMLRNLFAIGENELRERMRRRWRWVEVHSTAATAYATGREYMVNVVHVNEFGPCPSSGRLTAKGLRRMEAKLRKELPPERQLTLTP